MGVPGLTSHIFIRIKPAERQVVDPREAEPNSIELAPRWAPMRRPGARFLSFSGCPLSGRSARGPAEASWARPAATPKNYAFSVSDDSPTLGHSPTRVNELSLSCTACLSLFPSLSLLSGRRASSRVSAPMKIYGIG